MVRVANILAAPEPDPTNQPKWGEAAILALVFGCPVGNKGQIRASLDAIALASVADVWRWSWKRMAGSPSRAA